MPRGLIRIRQNIVQQVNHKLRWRQRPQRQHDGSVILRPLWFSLFHPEGTACHRRKDKQHKQHRENLFGIFISPVLF